MNILLEDESASIELGRLLSDALLSADEEKFEIHLEGNRLPSKWISNFSSSADSNASDNNRPSSIEADSSSSKIFIGKLINVLFYQPNQCFSI